MHSYTPHFRPEGKSLFDIPDRLGMKYIFKLMVDLSALLVSHEKNIILQTRAMNIVTLEHDWKTRHICPLHTAHRGLFAASIIQILVPRNLNQIINIPTIYLNGHRLLSRNEIRTILKATINYIKKTKCFSTN